MVDDNETFKDDSAPVAIEHIIIRDITTMEILLNKKETKKIKQRSLSKYPDQQEEDNEIYWYN